MAQDQAVPAEPDPASFPTQPKGDGPDPASFPVQAKAGAKAGAKKGPQGSALSRFGSNLYEGTIGGAIGTVETLGHNVNEEGLVKGSLTTIKGLIPTEHLAAATEARKRGDWGAWTSHMLRGIPIIGPIGEKIGGQLSEGDVAGAAGQLAALEVPHALGKAAKYLPPSVKTDLPIPMTRAERTGSRAAGYGEALTERTVPGAQVFRAFRAKQQIALQRMGEGAAQQILSRTSARGPGAARTLTTATEVGERVQKALTENADVLKGQANEVYAAIDEVTKSETKRVRTTEQVPGQVLDSRGNPTQTTKTKYVKQDVGGVQPSTQTLKQAALPILRRLQRESQLIPPGELARTKAILDRIMSAPAKLPFSAFQDARSDLLRIVRSYGDPVPGKAGGVAKKFAQLTDQALMDAAEQSGIPSLPFMVKQANGMWSDLKRVYNDAFIKKIGKASPEGVTAIIRKGDVEDINTLKEAIGPEAFKAASARAMQDVLAKATEPPPPISTGAKVGGTTGLTMSGASPVSPTTPVLQGHKIHQQLRDLGPERATALFGKEGAETLMEIADLAERVNPAKSQAMIPGLLAGGINAAVWSPILKLSSLYAGPAMTLGTAAGTYATFYSLAKVLTKQPGRIAYRNFVRGIATGNRPLALAAGNVVMQQMNKASQEPDPEATDGSGASGAGTGGGRGGPAVTGRQ